MAIAGAERNSNQPPESSSLYSLLSYFDQKEAQDIVWKFLDSPQARAIFTIIETFQPLTPVGAQGFASNVAGRIFEEVGVGCLRPYLQKTNEELTAPTETSFLYQKVHPKKKRINWYGLRETIDGITIPDGLILHEDKDKATWQITGSCEYTLRDAKRQKSHDQKVLQLRSYLYPYSLMENLRINGSQGQDHLGRMLHLVRPDLRSLPVCCSSTWRIVYVVPKDSSFDWPDQERVEQVFLPFTRKEFGGFIQGLLEHLRGRQRLSSSHA